ncbi:MAG: PAS domain S-box protein [Chloroflexota bacterium]|nr:PAS domain S-box protein [Chloroflexota bacterium]
MSLLRIARSTRVDTVPLGDPPAIVRDPVRLEALQELGLLDTPPEPAFDQLTSILARLLHTPIALVSLVAADRQFFKSAVGLSEPLATERQTPLSHSFCQHVVRLREPLVVEDARTHSLVCDNLAIRDLGVIAYLGVPLLSADGHALGALCAIDHVPRAWTADDVALVESLAAAVMSKIELQCEVRERRAAEAALRLQKERFELIARATNDTLWDWNLSTDTLWRNDVFHSMFGYYASEIESTSASWTERIHPEDRDGVVRSIHATISSGELYWSAEYRFRRGDDRYADVVDRGYVVHDAQGEPVRMVGSTLDITPRKQAEQELRAMLARLELQGQMLASVNDAVIGTDSDFRITYWNSAAEQLYGWAASEAISRPVHELIPIQRYFDGTTSAMARDTLFQAGQWRGEVIQRDRNGGELVIDSCVQLVYNTEGAVVGIMAINRDIRERKQAKEALHASETWFRVLFENSPDAMVLIDPHDRTELWPIIACNEAYCQMNGYRLDELLGRSFDLVHTTPGSPDELADFVGRLRPGQPIQEETIHRRKDGTTFPIEYATSLITLGGRELVLGIDRDITARKHTEAALRASEEQFRNLFANSPIGLYRTTPDGRVLLVNPALVRMLGYASADELTARRLDDTYAPQYARAAFREQLERAGEIIGLEAVWHRRDGTPIWVREGARVIRDQDGTVLYYDGTVEDITVHKQAQEALRLREEYFRALIENAFDTISIVNTDGTTSYSSPALSQMLGYAPEERQQQSVFALIHPDDLPQARAIFAQLLQQSGATLYTELRVQHKSGGWRVLELRATSLLHDPSVRGIVVNARDITERKEMQAQLMHDALHDPLTGLPNRALFFDQLRQAVEQAQRYPARLFAVLFLDLDRFKTINDSLGHAAGDCLLVEMGRRLKGCLRSGDTLARLGGDEFVILAEELQDPDDVSRMAERIHQVLAHPYCLDGHEVITTASIGVTLGSGGYTDPAAVLRDADIAMYRAKTLGRARHETFDLVMRQQAGERLQREAELRRALEHEEFVLHYQPIVDASRTIVGLETLVRWQHPVRGLVAPGEFIPLMEETGLIVPLGEWILRTACAQMKRWQDAGMAPIYIAVNMSALQFKHQNMREMVNSVLRETGLDPRYLELELTESMLMEDAEATVATLESLAQIKVDSLVIDDFGTGYSSLSYLQRLPIAGVKIDRSFVRDITTNPGNAAIATAIIALAHSLGLSTVAEGVETEEQLAWLQTRGCDKFQGYLISRPAPADAMEALIYP